jgi:D-lactate dehydrogenase (cytochrome)
MAEVARSDAHERNSAVNVTTSTPAVEAGVTRKQLNSICTTAACFAIDPGGRATLGGMSATRASARTQALRTMR